MNDFTEKENLSNDSLFLEDSMFLSDLALEASLGSIQPYAGINNPDDKPYKSYLYPKDIDDLYLNPKFDFLPDDLLNKYSIEIYNDKYNADKKGTLDEGIITDKAKKAAAKAKVTIDKLFKKIHEKEKNDPGSLILARRICHIVFTFIAVWGISILPLGFAIKALAIIATIITSAQKYADYVRRQEEWFKSESEWFENKIEANQDNPDKVRDLKKAYAEFKRKNVQCQRSFDRLDKQT